MSNGVSGRKDEDNSDDETQRLPQVDELAAAPAQPASPEQPSTPDTEVEDDVMAGEAPPHAGAGQPGPPGRRRRRWVIPGVLVLLVAAGYVGVAWYFGDHVPSGTSVAGVDIGGEERQGAITLLEDSLAEVTSTAIPVTLGTEEDSGVDIDPDGLSFDAQATVDGQVGFSLAPDRVFSHLFGGRSVAPQVQVDEDQVTDTLEQVAPDLNIEPVEGAIAFTDGEPEVTEPEIGTSMDVPAAVDLLGSEWLTGEIGRAHV